MQQVEAEELIKNASSDQAWVMGGYQPTEWEAQLTLKKQYPDRIKTCYGLHPWFIKSDEFDLSLDLEALKIWSDQADLIGEVGLDFFGDAQHLKKDTQINVFEKQLDVIQGKPFVFHIVQAHGKALEILNDHNVKGFVHSFSGSIEMAEQYISHGILLSFGTNILNKNFKKAREVIKEIPLGSLLIESDTPSHALDEECPLGNLDKVYKEAALIRGISVEELKNQVQSNFQKLF